MLTQREFTPSPPDTTDNGRAGRRILYRVAVRFVVCFLLVLESDLDHLDVVLDAGECASYGGDALWGRSARPEF